VPVAPPSRLIVAAPLATVLVGVLALSGCGRSTTPPAPPGAAPPAAAAPVLVPPPTTGVPTAPPTTPVDPPATAPPNPAAVLARPGVAAKVRPLGALVHPDVLVTGSLAPAAVGRIAALVPPGGAVVFGAGTVLVGGKQVRAAAVDPSVFRAFAAKGTAESDPVWNALARGEVVASHKLAAAMKLPLGGQVKAGPAGSLRLGALATTGIPGTDVIVGQETGKTLGLRPGSAVLLGAGTGVDAVQLAGKVRAIAGDTGTVDLLTAPAANPVAFLTGTRAAKAFGAFSYRYFPDGTIQPDAAWVSRNISSASVPIFGQVTCHRLMLPQLRGALQDVVAAGLSSSLHTYDGCYVPRFIESNPDRSVSLHTWGIAIDMDASTNYRGIRGTMDPRIVAIFKRWGFRWGGDWSYTDPMHFEIGALLTSPRS